MTALRSTLGIQIFSSQGCQWHISVRHNLTINTTNHTWIWSIISGKESGNFFQDFFVFWVVCFSTRGHVMTAVRSTLGMEISTSQKSSHHYYNWPHLSFETKSAEAWGKNNFFIAWNVFLFFILGNLFALSVFSSIHILSWYNSTV